MDRWREITLDEVEAVAAQFPQGCGTRTLERGRKLRDAVYLRCGNDVMVTTRKEWGMGTYNADTYAGPGRNADVAGETRLLIESLRQKTNELKSEIARCDARKAQCEALLAEMPVLPAVKAKRGRPVGSKNGKKQEA